MRHPMRFGRKPTDSRDQDLKRLREALSRNDKDSSDSDRHPDADDTPTPPQKH